MGLAPDQRWKVQVGQSISDILYISMGTHNIEIECKGAAGDTVASKVVECQVSEVNGFEWTETSQKIGDDINLLNDGLETIEVSSVEEIQNAVSNRKGVKLIQDLISYNDLEIEVPGSAMIIIDLNGHSLKAKSFVFKTFSGGTNIFSSNGYGLIWTSIQSKQTSLNQLVDSDGLSPNFGDYVKLKTYPYEAPIHSGGTEN